jgi:dienelactone hydrolase
VIRAHSLLLSFPEVDARRTAVTGISWGGYLTCIVAGLDDRFKAAVPVYGCGFLHENSCWLDRFGQMSDEARANWIQLWDPSRYVGSASMPMLFVNGGKDFAYPPDSHAKTYALVKSPKNRTATSSIALRPSKSSSGNPWRAEFLWHGSPNPRSMAITSPPKWKPKPSWSKRNSTSL